MCINPKLKLLNRVRHPTGRLDRLEPNDADNGGNTEVLWGVFSGNWPVISHNSVVDLHWQFLPFHYRLNLSVTIKSATFPMFVIENIFNKPAISKTGCLCTSTISVFLFCCKNREWGGLLKSWDSIQRLHTSSYQYTWHNTFSYLCHISFR